MAKPLASKLFTSPKRNQQLDDCLVKDSAHVELGAKGPHVSLIQTALFTIMPDVNLGDELGTETYGPRTAAAVKKFKVDRKILNERLGQVRPEDADAIVGIRTIDRLDTEMIAREPATPKKVIPVDTSIKVATIWINAFIGRDVKDADGTLHSFTVRKGPHTGETAIPGPFSKIPTFDDCFLTDQRSFDSINKTASSRIHAEVVIDFTGAIPTLRQIPPLGATVDTVRVRVSTGEVLNQARGIARGAFVKAAGFVAGSKEVTVRFRIAANNPIAKMPKSPILVPTPVGPIPIPPTPTSSDPQVTVNPDIDFNGEFTLHAVERTLKFRAFLDGFPFFEGYIATDGGSNRTIFQQPPEPGQTPTSGLLGDPHRFVEKDIRNL